MSDSQKTSDSSNSDKSEKIRAFKANMTAMGRTDNPVFCERCRGEGIDPWRKEICQDCGGYGYLNPLI